jgi:UDP-N-acetylglucosamine:LPS N-acetylglucosamine transferase
MRGSGTKESCVFMSGPRVLYVSGSIGLGHVSKDLAIAGALRRARPDVEIMWLAGHPASEVLRQRGEALLPESDAWVGASQVAEKCTRNGELNLVRYVYRSLPSWTVNARLFGKAVAAHHVDIAVGNEAYEVDIGLIVGLMRVRIPFVMIFDFVGTDAVTRNPLDRLGAYLLNAIWAGDGRVYGRTHHSAIYIGELDDVPAKPFGPALPNRREHARKHYNRVGHVINFRPEQYSDRAAIRRRLGYGEAPLVVCSVGGTSIGRDLLQLCARAFLPLRRTMPDARMVLVCGPRLPVASIDAPAEVEVRGYVPRLCELYACCDVAVVQCGASSTTELCALQRPFIYFPIEGHFEQEMVAARLARYGAGRRMTLREATPASLAEAIRQEYRRRIACLAMPTDGAEKAAAHILRALEGGQAKLARR